MEVYQFKVALDHDKRTYRNIDILECQTLEHFHEIIFTAFERYDEHLFSFYITRKRINSVHSRYKAPEFTGPTCFTDDLNTDFGHNKFDASQYDITSLRLNVKDKIYYLFDFGDCWWHEITLSSITETNTIKGFPKIVKKSGASPDQYPDFDEDDY